MSDVRSCHDECAPAEERTPGRGRGCDNAEVVEISRDDRDVVVRMSSEEAELLSFALRAGFETTSRAEYWISHGVAQPSVRELAAGVYAVATGERESATTTVERGVEVEENPRRPRPSS